MEPRSNTRYELDAALRQPGCPICHVSKDGVHHYLDGLVYESVNDPDVRQQVTMSLGFCNRHAWELRHIPGASFGIALLLRDALKQWEKQLAAVRPLNERGDEYAQRLLQANTPEQKCPACERQADIERRYIETLVESLSDRAFADALRRSAGLCRPHFAETCTRTADAKGLEALAAMQTEINRHLGGELDEFIRKNDYRFRDEGLGAEGDSWVRAIEHLSGAEDALC